MHWAVVLSIVLVGAVAEIKKYEGYKVYKVSPQNDLHALLLKSFENNENFDFWSELRKPGYDTDIMVSANAEENFKGFLEESGIPYQIIIEDVETTLEMERQSQAKAPKAGTGRISFLQYNTYPDIQSYLEDLQTNYPSLVQLDTIGKSYEGRDISIVRISSGGSNKPVILIDGGIHAREWIASAVALYIIQELVENTANRQLLEQVDWHIIPVLNPDGYQFTHTSTRLWRKNRSRGTRCDGVDLNRNFNFHWMLNGASDDECSEIYAGRSGASEVESTAFANYVNANNRNIKLYLTFHSYGQYLLYPWGYTSALPDDWQVLNALAVDVNRAISAVAGTRYEIGTSTNVLYAAAGGSDDWVKGVGGVNLSYTIELPGGGIYGFDLPTSRILPVVRETWQGILVYHNYIQSNFART